MFPGSTAWVAYPLAAMQAIGAGVGTRDGETLATYLTRTEPVWRGVLRALWCTLAASSLLLAAGLAREWVPRTPQDGAAPGLARSGRWSGIAAGLLTAVLLLASPGWARGVAALSPAVPGALLLLLLTRALAPFDPPGPARAVVLGLLAGVLLAWASFLWPAAVLAFGVMVARRWPVRVLVTTLLMAGVCALVAEPAQLLDLRSALTRLVSEWSRQGGAPAGLAGQGDLWRFLTLQSHLGPFAVAVAAVAAVLVFWRARGPRRFLAGWALALLGLFVVLPATLGLRDTAAVQLAIVPLLAAGLGGGVLAACRLAPQPAARWLLGLGALAAILSFAGVVGPRLQMSSRDADPAALGHLMVAELQGLVGTQPWLLERDLPGGVQPPGHALVLPRDSRRPARYDFAYWPRWYSGFRHVLVSYAQGAANRGRPDARVPRHFYGQLEASADRIASWGRHPDSGEPLYGLYRIRPSTTWEVALQPDEMAQLNPVPDLGAFLTQLGAVYAEAGVLPVAAVVLEGGIDLAPESTPLYNNLASVYMQEGEWESAARVLGEGLQRDPQSFELLYNAGRTYAELGAQGRAEQFFRQAIHQRPELPITHYQLARCFLAQSKYALTRAALLRFLELDPNSTLRPQVEQTLEQVAPFLREAGSTPSP